MEEAWEFGQLCHQLAPGAFSGHLTGVQLAHSWRGPKPGATRHPWVWRVPNQQPPSMPRWRRCARSGIMIDAWCDIMIESLKEWDSIELDETCRSS